MIRDTFSVIFLVIILTLSTFTNLYSEEDFIDERLQMLEEISRYYSIDNDKVKEALLSVPRHLFVPQEYRLEAYGENPLPIGHGQTISAPAIVAAMTDLLNLNEDSKVLEIGTGSGYQAAILAELTREVYTIEVIEELFISSTRLLNELNYDYINTKNDDGYYGWEEYSPFDAIIVTAAADHIPPDLIKQLANGGAMVIPVGPPSGIQRLLYLKKDSDGNISREDLGFVRFVPFVH